MFFFLSGKRRHTRYWRDWSSDVCSSDLDGGVSVDGYGHAADFAGLKGGKGGGNEISDVAVTVYGDTAIAIGAWTGKGVEDPKSAGVGKRVDLGGRRLIKKKNRNMDGKTL